MLAFTRSLAVLASATAGLACSGIVAPREEPPFRVEVAVESDPGVPISSVELMRSGGSGTLATTGADGRAKFSLKGTPGSTVSIEVKCPDDYQPTKPVEIRLLRLASGVLHKSASCLPKKRKAIIAVLAQLTPGHTREKAVSLAGLKVRIRGQERAVTDESGAAHVLLDVDPDEQLQVTVDTSANPSLHPQNPVLPIVTKPRDDIYPLPVTFEPPKQPKVIYVAGPKRHGPALPGRI